jgi:hypothetical protein
LSPGPKHRGPPLFDIELYISYIISTYVGLIIETLSGWGYWASIGISFGSSLIIVLLGIFVFLRLGKRLDEVI